MTPPLTIRDDCWLVFVLVLIAVGLFSAWGVYGVIGKLQTENESLNNGEAMRDLRTERDFARFQFSECQKLLDKK